jgi:SAM-dependent methyltransferase
LQGNVTVVERISVQDFYGYDLASIHDAGFGDLASHAAPLIIQELQRGGVHGGTAVDLGCGSGISARLLRDAGYEVVGIDLSEALIEMARERVPDAIFRVGSFATADIPPCVAVLAVGEVLNYTADATNSPAARDAVFQRIYAALAPGGVLLCDLAGPDRAPAPSPRRTFIEGPTWAVLVEAEADAAKSLLTRRITTFRQVGELYRRDFEVHQLQLVDPAEVVETLRRIGFEVRTLAAYGPLPLLQGVVGFLARKPRR